jgi:hypothetical protein
MVLDPGDSLTDPTSSVATVSTSNLLRWWVGFGYLVWWFSKVRVSRFLTYVVSVTLLFSLIILLFHVAAESQFDAVKIQLAARYKWFPHVVFLYKALWGLSLVAAARHEIHNWRTKKQQLYFVDSLDFLLSKLDDLVTRNQLPWERRLQEFTDLTLQLARASFRSRKAVRANFAKLVDGQLSITNADPPDTQYAPGFSLRVGEGGSGYAAANLATVYFPWIWMRHAVHIGWNRAELPAVLKSKGVNLDLFVPVEGGQTMFRSVLCTAVVWEDKKCWGVLNFDSSRQDAFCELDFKVAAIFAQLLAIGFKRLTPQPSAGTPVPVFKRGRRH